MIGDNKDRLEPMRRNWNSHSQLIPTSISHHFGLDEVFDLLDKLVPVSILLHIPNGAFREAKRDWQELGYPHTRNTAVSTRFTRGSVMKCVDVAPHRTRV